MANKNQQPAYPSRVRQKWYFMTEKAGKTVEVCALYFIPRKTYYKWRNIDQGSRIYKERGRHPHTKIKDDVAVFVSEQKLRLNYGPEKMRLLVKRRFGINVSTTAIYKFYKRKGLVRRVQKKLPWYTQLKDPLVPTRPGEVVQMDAKYVWGDGMRKYQRTFIDIFTGRQYAVVVSTMTAEDTINAFEEAVQAFPFPILGVQSDNGSENRGAFHQYLGEHGIAHYFIPKSSPTLDGVVERAHGVIDQEFYLNPTRPWKTLPEYLSWYNYERIHLGKYLNGMTPQEKWQWWLPTVSPLKVN